VSALLQLVVVAGLLGWSLCFMLRRWLPAPARALQQRLAELCVAHGWAGLGQWLRPAAAVSTGCGSGCNNCSTGCAASAVAPAEQAVQWRQPPGACH